jgi:hypothetical protein
MCINLWKQEFWVNGWECNYKSTNPPSNSLNVVPHGLINYLLAPKQNTVHLKN